MLKNIPPIISPELLKVLAEMGHGDYIVLCDANCPVDMFCRNGGAIKLRADGISATELLKAILELMPIDQSVPTPFVIGNKTEYDKGIPCPIWDEFKEIASCYDKRGVEAFIQYERDKFCDFISHCYAIVQTGERALYGNIAIRKGVITPIQ
ncbi:MAG: RbsD/FucU domain-containing protein [Herbinix sp.]|nr:RbsD/FucU domain-containing protein [Herbinix sp.]